VTARRAAIAAVAALLVAVAGALLLFESPRWFRAATTTTVGAPTAAPVEPGRTIKARLFYVSEDGTQLTSVEREVPFAEGPEQAREIVNAQIALVAVPPASAAPPAPIAAPSTAAAPGTPIAIPSAAAAPGTPAGPPLVSAVPPGTTLRGVYITERGDAYVDLSGAAVTTHPGGTLGELLTVYTIVDVLTVNLPAIQAVQILIDGKEVATLAGHVDLRQPLAKNLGLVQ
jgi:hypothetical protein